MKTINLIFVPTSMLSIAGQKYVSPLSISVNQISNRGLIVSSCIKFARGRKIFLADAIHVRNSALFLERCEAGVSRCGRPLLYSKKLTKHCYSTFTTFLLKWKSLNRGTYLITRSCSATNLFSLSSDLLTSATIGSTLRYASASASTSSCKADTKKLKTERFTVYSLFLLQKTKCHLKKVFQNPRFKRITRNLALSRMRKTYLKHLLRTLSFLKYNWHFQAFQTF